MLAAIHSDAQLARAHTVGADVFMLSIEEITSAETKKTIVIAGSKQTRTVSLWNPTVANLTLMALGSSAPEILLSCIEISTSGFYAGNNTLMR